MLAIRLASTQASAAPAGAPRSATAPKSKKGYGRVPGNSARTEVERTLRVPRKMGKHVGHVSGHSALLKGQLDPTPTGILVVGASGMGKTELLRAIVEEHGEEYQVKTLDGSQLAGGCSSGKCVESMERAWDGLAKQVSAAGSKPGLLIIDGIDQADPSVHVRLGELMNGLSERPRITLVATARSSNAIPSHLRRPGVFEAEHTIKALDVAGRRAVLEHITSDMKLATDVDLDVLANDTSGSTPADLHGVIRRATLNASDRAGTGGLRAEETKLTRADFSFVYDDFSPAGLREMSMKVAKVTFADVGGLTKAKQELMDHVIDPLKNPQKYVGFTNRAVKGVILYGPPGTGKTLLAEALAREAGVNFVSLKASDIFRTSYVGDASRAIAEFKTKIVAAKPAIVLIDEADGLLAARTQAHSDGGQERAQAMNDFLQLMDGAGRETDGVVFVMTTNRPELMDSAVRRSGRTDLMIKVGLQGPKGRRKAIDTLLRDRKIVRSGAQKLDIDAIVDATGRYTGAELEALVNEAGRLAVHRGAAGIEMQDIKAALDRVTPQTPTSEKESDDGE